MRTVLVLGMLFLSSLSVQAKEVDNNFGYTFTDAKGNTYSSDAIGIPKVLIFGRDNCFNTFYTLQTIAENQQSHNGIDLIHVEVDSPDAETLGNYEKDMSMDYMAFVTSKDASDNMWSYLHKFPEVCSGGYVTLPVVIYINSNNKVVRCTSGSTDAGENIKELFGGNDQQDEPIEQQDEIKDFSINVTYCQTEARSMLEQVNAFRQDESMAWYWDENDSEKIYCSNLSALEYDYYLEEIAMKRAAEIAVKYSHQRPDGTNVFSLMDNYMSAGENIAYGQKTSEEVFVAWREDEDSYEGQGHRRNMLGDSFNRVGFGCVEFQGRKFWVQVFGGTLEALPDGEKSAADGKKTVIISALESNIIACGFCETSGNYRIEVGQCNNIKMPDAYIRLKDSSFEKCCVEIPLSCSVDNTDIVSYASGKVCAKAQGNATITITGSVAGKNIETTRKVEAYVYVSPVKYQTPSCYANKSYTYTSTDGDTITTTADGHPKVIIFFDQDCYWCDKVFENIENNPQAYAECDVVALDIYEKSLENVSKFAEDYSGTSIKFGLCDVTDMLSYYTMVHSEEVLSWGTPFIIFVNKDNLVVYNLDGYVDNFSDYVRGCFSEDWNTKAKACVNKEAQQQIQPANQQVIQPNQQLIPQINTNNISNSQSTNRKKVITVETNDDDNTNATKKKSSKPSVGAVNKLNITIQNGSMVLKWKKVKKITGYQLQISTNKKFKKAKTISLKSSKTSYSKSGLVSGKTYYIRVRAYKKYKDAKKKTKKAYGAWMMHNVKIIKIK